MHGWYSMIVNICKQSECGLAFSLLGSFLLQTTVFRIMFGCKLQQLPSTLSSRLLDVFFVLILICTELPLLSIRSVSFKLSFSFSDISAAWFFWCNLTPSTLFNASVWVCVYGYQHYLQRIIEVCRLYLLPLFIRASAWVTYRASALQRVEGTCALNVEQTNIYWSWLLTAWQSFKPWAPAPREAHTAKVSACILWKHACLLLLTPVCTVLTAWTKSPWTFGVCKI